jgi:hypothetical protein
LRSECERGTQNLQNKFIKLDFKYIVNDAFIDEEGLIEELAKTVAITFGRKATLTKRQQVYQQLCR